MHGNGYNGTVRIGFYICHCGHNIASIVDVKAVAEYVRSLSGVVVSTEYKYMCSDPDRSSSRKILKNIRLIALL